MKDFTSLPSWRKERISNSIGVEGTIFWGLPVRDRLWKEVSFDAYP
ncbi:MAG: hypothetical protein WEA56_14340 [Balneolaceae bacterium]